MFEELLAYPWGAPPSESFSALLAADLDEDARLFYDRTATDIATVAAGVGRSHHRARIVRMLLVALVAPSPARAPYWRHLYREISALAAGIDPRAVPPADRDAFAAAIDRLRAFLRENLDLADAFAIEELGRSAFRRAVWA